MSMTPDRAARIRRESRSPDVIDLCDDWERLRQEVQRLEGLAAPAVALDAWRAQRATRAANGAANGAANNPPSPANAANGAADRKAYMRDLMRRRRAEARASRSTA